MSDTNMYVTMETFEKMREELQKMKSIDRPAASKAIGEAREKGDLKENAEYDAAKEAQGMLEMRIAKLQETVRNARLLDETQIDFTYSFDINSDFIEQYNKAKKALGSDEVKIQALFGENGDKGIYFTLGGKTSHDDKISFQANASEMTVPSPEFQFNANYLFEIFTENKGAKGTGCFDENGILKLEFIDESSIKALYYLPPKN